MFIIFFVGLIPKKKSTTEIPYGKTQGWAQIKVGRLFSPSVYTYQEGVREGEVGRCRSLMHIFLAGYTCAQYLLYG